MTDQAILVLEDVPSRHVATPPRVSLFRWTLACTAGELLGFAAAGLVGALVFAAMPHARTAPFALVFVAAVAAAGLIEGAMLGLWQWWALRRAFRPIHAWAWVTMTALAGAIGWLLASLPALLASVLRVASMATGGSAAVGPPGFVQGLIVSAGLGSMLGTMFGAFQWVVLRRHTSNGGTWVLANLFAWMLALPWTYLAGRVVTPATPPALLLLSVLAAGTLMGLTVALVTGAFLRRLVVVGSDSTPRASAGRPDHPAEAHVLGTAT